MKIYGLTKLYLPIIIFVCLIIFFFILKRQDEELYIISFGKFGLSIKIPIDSFEFKKGLLIFCSIISLSSYLFYDFSEFFPKRLKMEVFFDEEGIDQQLTLFSKDELDNLHILSQNISAYQSGYYDLMNSEAKKLLKLDFFSVNRKDVHSEGETSFIIQKISGIHNYHLKESKGELRHLLEKPKCPIKEYYTFFDKITSPSDKMTPSFNDIFIKNKIILKPRFKQIISERIKSKGKVFDHILGGYTIVNIFPYPKFSNTLYLLELDNVGLIPIGYAVYR